MQPQGSATLNTTVIDNMIAQVNACNVCADLQAMVSAAFASLAPIKAAINAEITSLEAAAGSLTPPGASLTGIVTWITDLINNVLTPILKPLQTYIAQLTLLESKIAELTTAIAAAEARITSCSISIPSI